MSDEEREPDWLDRLVEKLASVMDSFGLNGRRVRWRWQQQRREMAEARARREILARSAKGRHKMCPECRSLVEKGARECPECGVSLERVKAPSTGRLVTNLLPGITAATSLLMLVNGFWFVIMLMAQMKSGGAGGLGLFSAFDLEMLVRFGAGLSEPRMLADGTVTGGEWWRFITPIFLHGGLLHFFFNSYLLLNLGPIVEDLFGTERYWVIYLACGISGAMLTQKIHFVITVGASGAIFGLIGLLLIYGLRNHGALGESMKSLIIRLLIYSFIMSVLIGGRIDHWNHLGGFLCGALAGYFLKGQPYRSRAEAYAWQLLAVGGVAGVVFAFYKVATLGSS